MIVAIAVAAFLIGFSKAGVAGTLGPFVTVLVVMSVPADDAVGLLLPMLIVADWFTVAAHWRRWDTSTILALRADMLKVRDSGSGRSEQSAVPEISSRKVVWSPFHEALFGPRVLAGGNRAFESIGERQHDRYGGGGRYRA